MSLATRNSTPRKKATKYRPLRLNSPEATPEPNECAELRLHQNYPQTSPNEEIPNILRSQSARDKAWPYVGDIYVDIGQSRVSSEVNDITKNYVVWKSEGTANLTPTPANPPTTQTTDTEPSGEPMSRFVSDSTEIAVDEDPFFVD